MAEFKLSRIRYTWKGTWNPSAEYIVDDVINYGGKSYVCLVKHSASPNFYTDLEFLNSEIPPVAEPKWELMIDGYRWLGDWGISTFYSIGDIIKYHGVIYLCTDSHTSASTVQGFEEDKATRWEIYVSSYQWKNEWTTTTYYKLNDVVKFGGAIYICTEEHTSASDETEGIYVDIDKWLILSLTDSWNQDWETPRIYQVNDVVRFGGIVYRCIEGHISRLTFEEDAGHWEIVHSGVSYTGEYRTSNRYKLNDIVKFGGSLWICTVPHNSGSSFVSENWTVYAPGYEYELEWNDETVYQPGDAVRYGGYLYISSSHNIDKSPSSNPSDWTVARPGVRISGDWSDTAQYLIGDTVRFGGQLFTAVANSTNQKPAVGTLVNTSYWELIIPGDAWKGDWQLGFDYAIGDVVHWLFTTYRCKNVHTSTSLNSPANDLSNTYWDILIVGDSANVLKTKGDIKTHDGATSVAVELSGTGTVIKSINGAIAWSKLNESEKVYYVSPNGVDEPENGTTLNSPWRTIRYACENITGPATIFIKTGLYQEVLPIRIPAYVALVGDELRGTVVEPAPTLIPETDILYSVEALSYIKSIIQDLLFANSITPIYGTVDQNTSNAPATLNEVGDIRDLIDTIRNIINGVAEPSMVGTNTASVDANVLLAVDHLADNKEFLVSQTIGYIRSQHPEYIFSESMCARDLRKFIDAIIYDISYPGNYKSIEAGRYYANAADGDRNARSNMFYMRDSTGIRNMTLRGLVGELTPVGLGAEETRRPTGGAYVSFDPGWGPTDSTTWVGTRSPYVQNVTTFGVGCVGLKLDGDLHNGGNKTIVANDFTQVLSDGIGVWANKDARTEIVSVFTYYNHIGYLAENGGKIRATNGNNSYGKFGSVSEGFNTTESPITATVNNRYYDAEVSQVFCSDSGIEKLFFSNAGQDYTTASYTITGAGINASLIADEFRDGGISEVRLVDPGDSSIPGGGSYLFTTNNAQDGDSTTVTIAASDENLEENYLGMRLIITKGKGSGQYGYISAYDNVSKIASISKESDDTAGWDHLVPETTIETSLDTTTVYTIEPRVIFSSPGTSVTTGSLPSAKNWRSVTSGNGKFVAIGDEIDNGVGNAAAYSTNGTSWTASSLPANRFWRGVTYGNSKFVAIGHNAAATSTDGITWTAQTISTGLWTSIVYAQGKFVVIESGGKNVAYSTDGISWSTTVLPVGAEWSSIAYGKGKFVAVALSDSTVTDTVYSTDGITWNTGSFAGGCSCVAYGNGKFVAFDGAVSGDTVFYSTDGITWTSVTIDDPRNWKSVVYGQGRFVALADNYPTALTSTDGITWSTIDLATTATWTSVTFGKGSGTVNKFVGISGNSTIGSSGVVSISAGVTAQARVQVSAGRISSVNLWEPGSGYSSAPVMTLVDPNNTSDATVNVRINNGVLANPSIINKGTGYQTLSTFATVTGNGFMDSYQLGKELVVSNLTRIPSPGDNLTISGINDYTYKVTSVTILEGTSAPYTAKIIIIKGLDRAESPDHNTLIQIRERYSQVRITGHDLLDIGLGNFEQTNFPDILNPIGTIKSPENELVERNGGRVFYTSTNDLGNFRVGELFAVEQATGTVTLNADFFELQGLEELKLGGVSVGGTSVVIREFSTDSTFTADSNNIVPTQRSIKAYLTRRVSGGGSDAITGGVTSGLIVLGPNSITTTTNEPIIVPVKVTFKQGIDGTLLALSYFTRRN